VLNIAHRGARGFAPENTLEAFRKAAALGCQMFELDVHQCKDGELIVVHDDDLVRCSDVTKKFPGRSSYAVSEFNAAEIRMLDAGSWFVAELDKPALRRQPFLRVLTAKEIERFITLEERKHYASGQVRHPTLREALELAREKKLFVNVEIKNLYRFYPNIAAAIVKLITEMKLEPAVIISSFDHEVLAEVRRLNKQIATAILVRDRLHDPARYLRDLLDGDAYHPTQDLIGFGSADGRLQTAELRKARTIGLAVNVWTVNDAGRMRQLVDAGVSGIITDYPNRLNDVLAAGPSR
jgi:glycerophosphoryl diester phosphodiesterase